MNEKVSSAYSYPLIIKQFLHTPLTWAPTREIVYRDLFRYDYRRFVERVGRLASALASLGVKPGSTIGVMDWDSHRYLESFFAIPMMGAVLHTINIRLSPEQLLYTIEHAEDDVILINSDFLPLIEKIKGRIDTVRKFILLTDSPEKPLTHVDVDGEYEELLAANSPDYPFPDLDENTQATTFYTTGTTGLPKGVYFSHRQLVLHALGLMATLGTSFSHGRFHGDDVYMPLTPMFHVHAWGAPYVATMMGVKQVYPGRYEPEMLLRLLMKEGVTFSHCVPTIIHMLVNSPVAKKVDFSRWKVIIGGSALPKSLARAALDLGIDIFTGYGMSETCPMLSLSHLTRETLEGDQERQVEIRCKAGRPAPLVQLRIVDEEMNDVPHDGKSTGEIVARAPWLTQGYSKDGAASERLWRGGFLHTGDVASMDERGYVQIADRLKDVIKTGGEWISSLELEDFISQHAAVSEVAVVGVPNERWGERPVAIVVLKPGHDAAGLEDEIKALVKSFADRGLISEWGVPDRVHFAPVIEKTSVGKFDKKELRKKYEPPVL